MIGARKIFFCLQGKVQNPRTGEKNAKDEEGDKECRDRVTKQNLKKRCCISDCLSEETSVITPATQR